MPKLVYRKLIESDLNMFIELRINQLQEEGAEPTCDLRPLINFFK